MALAIMVRFQLAMELACWAAEALPMSSDEVHFTAHQLAPVHVTHGRPGHLDSLPLLLLGHDARCGVVPAPILASSSPAQPAEP